MTDTDNIPILTPRPLLLRAGHFADRIGKAQPGAAPAETEKWARAMAELYKTAALMQNFNAQEAERNDSANYDTFPAPSPEQEAELRRELLGYYESLYDEQAAEGAVHSPPEREAVTGVQRDVASDSPERPTPAR